MLVNIPSINLPQNWASIPIKECGEALVLIERSHKRMIQNPIYYNSGIKGAVQEMYIRETILNKLQNVIDQFPENYQLVLYDAYRSIEVQKNLYYTLREEIKSEFPEMSVEELEKTTSTYLSFPTENDLTPSPHTTGGAIDLTLAYKGRELDMGTGFDDFSEAAYTAYFEKPESNLSNQEMKIRNNRRLLYYAMIQAGFTNFPVEWWHYDYGNQYWAEYNSKEQAIYGRKEP